MSRHRISFNDLSLDDYGLTERVRNLRGTYFKAVPEICVERSRLITRYHLEYGLLDQERISILDKARVYRRVLQEREPIIQPARVYGRDNQPITFEDRSLFAGSTTSKLKGVILYPEFLALSLWPELHTISRRSQNPYRLTETEAEILNTEVFPYWLDKTIMEIGRVRAENCRKSDPTAKRPDFPLLQKLVFFLASKPNCISHAIPDFSKAVNRGLRSIMEEAAFKRSRTADESKHMFYSAVIEVMEGIIAYAQNLSARAKQLAARQSDPLRKKELEELAQLYHQVPEYHARSFREGLTTVWMCWAATLLETPNVGLSLGRLDQLLYDLYQQDVENGTLSVQDAIELICCLWLKIGDHVPFVSQADAQLFGGTGSDQAIIVGGIDEDGRDAVNDLTFVMLRATELMGLKDPNLNARYCPGINRPEYLKRICLANIRTAATPAIHNDIAVIKALCAKGDDEKLARDYGVVGYAEPVSDGSHYSHRGALLLNLTSTLELSLFNGRHRRTGMQRLVSYKTGNVDEFNRFELYIRAFELQVRWLVDTAVEVDNAYGQVHQDVYPTPILSAFVNGSMEKSQDLTQAGELVNSSGATVIGLAEVIDSLAVIKKLVFDERRLTLSELVQIIEKDFQGDEVLRNELMNPKMVPKYGNQNPEADRLAAWVFELLEDAFSTRRNFRGGAYRVGYWSMINYAGLGRLIGALPSGRKARENFAGSITPKSKVKPYSAKTLNSTAALPMLCIPSGMAPNIKLFPEGGIPGDEHKMNDHFASVVEAYFTSKSSDCCKPYRLSAPRR